MQVKCTFRNWLALAGTARHNFQYVGSVHFTDRLKILGIVGDSAQTLAFGVFLWSKVNKNGENVVWDWTDTLHEFLKVQFLGGSKVTFLCFASMICTRANKCLWI